MVYLSGVSFKVFLLFSHDETFSKCRFLFYTALITYKRYDRSDCLWNNNLQEFEANIYKGRGPINCLEWCTNNNTCGGFSIGLRPQGNVILRICYFKTHACRNNIVRDDDVYVYIKQGRSI